MSRPTATAANSADSFSFAGSQDRLSPLSRDQFAARVCRA